MRSFLHCFIAILQSSASTSTVSTPQVSPSTPPPQGGRHNTRSPQTDEPAMRETSKSKGKPTGRRRSTAPPEAISLLRPPKASRRPSGGKPRPARASPGLNSRTRQSRPCAIQCKRTQVTQFFAPSSIAAGVEVMPRSSAAARAVGRSVGRSVDYGVTLRKQAKSAWADGVSASKNCVAGAGGTVVTCMRTSWHLKQNECAVCPPRRGRVAGSTRPREGPGHREVDYSLSTKPMSPSSVAIRRRR